jgi:hypothetical protein
MLDKDRRFASPGRTVPQRQLLGDRFPEDSYSGRVSLGEFPRKPCLQNSIYREHMSYLEESRKLSSYSTKE